MPAHTVRCRGRPHRAVVEFHGADEGSRDACGRPSADHGAGRRAEERLRGDEGTRLLVAIILAQEAVDDAGPEDESAVVTDAHGVPFDAGERSLGAFRVGADETGEEPLGTTAADADRVRDGVHGAAPEERHGRERVIAVDVQETRQRHLVGAVASADPEDVDALTLEVLRDAVQLVDGTRFADDTVIAQALRQAPDGPRILPVLATLRIEDDSDSRHGDLDEGGKSKRYPRGPNGEKIL
ncbi:MAG: hypothetical protein U0169_27200 [Polyangiaceae bacterium]